MSLSDLMFDFCGFIGEEALVRLLDYLQKKHNDKKENEELSKLIINYLRQEEKLLKKDKSCLDYDFESLSQTLLGAVLDTNSLCRVFSVDKATRESESMTIAQKCKNAAQPRNSESEERIQHIIDICYGLVCKFYALKIAPEDFLLAQSIYQAINSDIILAKEELEKQISALLDEKFAELKRQFEEANTGLSSTFSSDSFVRKQLKSDNLQFLEMLNTKLFLEEQGSTLSLSAMYIEPLVRQGEMLASDYISNWMSNSTGIMLLYGGAGIGKSSLVAKLVEVSCVENGCIDNPNESPILAVALRDHCELFSKYDHGYTEKAIICELFGVNGLSELDGKTLVLDGFDELTVLIASFDQSAALKFIKNLNILYRSLHLKSHLIITSREGYFHINFTKIDISHETLCWTENQVDQWCKKYSELKPTSEKWCNDFLFQYQKLPRNRSTDKRYEILCIPFILYLCSNSGVDLEKNKTICQLYDQSFRAILMRKHGDDLAGAIEFDSNVTEEQQRLVLWQYAKELAYQMFLLNSLTLSEEGKENSVMFIGLKRAKERTIKIIEEKINESSKYRIRPENLSPKAFLAIFSFAKDNGQNGITFVHKTVYEYFTAIKIYEDYFASLNSTRFRKMSEEQQMKEVIQNTVEAFRYKSIPKDIFAYLFDICDKSIEPFGKEETESKWYDYDLYKQVLLKALNDRFDCKTSIPNPVEEYVLSIDSRQIKSPSDEIDPCKEISPMPLQIARAYNNITRFLTGQGFTNKPSDSLRWLNEMVYSASDQSVNMCGWDLNGYVFDNSYLVNADFRQAELKDTSFKNANLQICNFRKACLQNAKLSGAFMRLTNFGRADLKNADLKKSWARGAIYNFANLQEANLDEADLIGSSFSHAKLYKTSLIGASMRSTRFVESNIQEAILYGADLSYSYIERTEMPNSNLIDANLSFSNLLRVNMKEARLDGANLCNVKFRRVDLSCADLRNACLIGADLRGVNLNGANLSGANLFGANLCDADLSNTLLFGADLRCKFSKNTKFIDAHYGENKLMKTHFPDGFNPDEHLMELDNSKYELQYLTQYPRWH